MGIKSPIVASPSISLGATDVNLLELVNAYATAMNDGKYHEPVLVTKIEDREGNVIYTAPTEQTQVMSYRAAYLTQTLLFSAIKEPGSTVAALWSYIHDVCRDTDFGGKTGTSNNHSDAWFVGTTPNLIGGSWVGGEYRCIHFRTGALGQGSRTALPIFGYFMDMVLKDPAFSKYKGQFKWKPNPDLLNGEKIDYSSYTCASCYVSRNDSTQNDSLAATTEKAEGETDGKDGDKSASQSSEKKKKKDDGMINFDDI
jgi:penicillin-binding protein 1A